MSKKPKLTTAQNMQLKDLDLQEKLNLLHQWKKEKEISQQAFEHFSNLWIKKESRKVIAASNSLRRRPGENLEKLCCRSIVEGEIRHLINNMRGKINSYIADRNIEGYSLSADEMTQFKKYVTSNFRCYKLLVNQLLILGLRYPDKGLNQFCSDFVRDNKKNFPFLDYFFWGMLWEDEDFVPLDAIRLMLVKKDNDYKIDTVFEMPFIRSILPLMEAQRDKETLRLAQAQMLEGKERERQVSRKMHRLNAFNTLIAAAQEYCK